MNREEFMDIVYDELYSDGDNNRANRIIDAADEYAEEYAESAYTEVFADTNLISRQASIKAEEAIAILRSLQDWLYFSAMNGGTKLQREAIDIAIDALKREQGERT